jgi:hypothetical protein
MAWTDSRVFTQAILNPLTASAWSTTEPTTYGANGLSADTIKGALFNNTTTPDRDAAVGSTGYNTGVWVTGNEVIDTLNTNWVAGGRALASKTFAAGTSIVNFDAADLAGAGTLTITNAFGLFVYDDTITAGTVAKQGLCFNYFGGAQTVTGGTFTVIFDATGILKFTN